MRDPSSRYLAVLFGVCAAVLGAVLALNWTLGLRALGSQALLQSASAWQEQTRGVTYAPPISSNRPFKSLRLHDRLPELDGVVFGASTVMSVTAAMFPPDLKVYNFAQTGNPLAATIGEAEYLLRHDGGRLRRFFIPLDWALGHPFQAGAPLALDLSVDAALAAGGGSAVSWSQRLYDALSLPKIKALGAILRDIARSGSPLSAFRQVFLQDAGDPYLCPDGVPARDYDVMNRGICLGFRYDGSATFTDQKRVVPERVPALILAARSPGSKYAQGLLASGGAVKPELLARLAGVHAELTTRGGGLTLILPPLLPGLEQAFLAAPDLGPPLRRAKAELDAWARLRGIAVIDAGRSEAFGCTVAEFIDEHHALPACFERVLGHFWREAAAAGALPRGLWPPPG